MQLLKQRYDQHGKNFYFKSRNLDLPTVDNRVIGRILKQLKNEGYLKQWTRPKSLHESTYLTKFEGDGELEKIELGENWYLEKPSPNDIWYLVDKRDEGKAVPFPSLKVTKANRDDKGKLLKQILAANELLAAQTDIIQEVFPRPSSK